MKSTTQLQFKLFIEKALIPFIDALNVDDCIGDIETLKQRKDEIASMLPKDANKALREYISDKAVARLSDRFRAAKYRKTNNKKTVQITKDTHKRLMNLKEALNAADIDEVIDDALSPIYDNDILLEKELVANEVYNPESFAVAGFLKRLSYDDQYKVILLLTQIYEDAWKSARRTRSNRPNIMEEKMTQHRYLKAIFKDEKLLKILKSAKLITGDE